MNRFVIKFIETIFIWHFCFPCLAQQNNSFKEQLKLIDSLKSFIQHKTDLKVWNGFYTKWANPNDSMYIFVYASKNDKVQSVIDSGKSAWKYFDKEDSATVFIKKLKLQGYHTLLYRTAGASSAFLNKELLSYPNEAVAFILFHEATHQQIRSSNKAIPYAYEEATCDAVANKFCKLFAQQTGLVSISKVHLQERIFERCYKFLNREKAILDSTHSDPNHIFRFSENRIKSLIKHGNQFHKDRMLYEINNAYILRISYYSSHYFEVKKYLQETNDISKVVNRILSVTKN